jgi:hypothetical protein
MVPGLPLVPELLATSDEFHQTLIRLLSLGLPKLVLPIDNDKSSMETALACGFILTARVFSSSKPGA